MHYFTAKAVIIGGLFLGYKLHEIVVFHLKQSGLSRNQFSDLAGVG